MPSAASPRIETNHRRLFVSTRRGSVVRTALAIIAALPGLAHASSLTVPDNVPTVQAALDAGVDTVLVRAGSHAESPTASTRVVLLGIPGQPAFVRPVLQQLFIYADHSFSGTLVVRGLEFNGQVRIANTNPSSAIVFENCHFMGGINDFSPDPPTSEMKLRKCLVVGDAALQPEGRCEIDSCTFEGQLSVRHSDCELVVQDSEFHGAGGGTGISCTTELRSATVARNTVSGFTTGLFLDAWDGIMVADNTIRDCTGNGIYMIGDGAEIARNRVERCGGAGLLVIGRGSVGVRANVITGSGDSGLFLDVGYSGHVIGNVISGSRRHGMEIHGLFDGVLEVTNNTSAFNRESGFSSGVSAGSGSYVLFGNIGYGNRTHGVQWQTSEVTFVGCNDWFANGLGAVQGMPPSSEDFAVDPLFCNGDFHLSSASPLVDMPSCGLVGALGIGCGVLSTPGRAADGFRLANVRPNPARGPVTIELELAREAEISVDIFDVQGRLVASPARGSRAAGRHALEWSPSSMGGRAPAGLYLVRFRFPGGEEKRRVILVP